MKTELLMTIGFIMPDGGEEGKRIVGTIEPQYPTDDLSWLNLRGKEIMIQTSRGDMFFKVKEIHVFNSMWGAINIGLTLDTDNQLDAIKVGDKVWK